MQKIRCGKVLETQLCNILLVYEVLLKRNLASENVRIIPLLGKTPRNIHTHVCKKTFIRMLIKMLIVKQKLEIVLIVEKLIN